MNTNFLRCLICSLRYLLGFLGVGHLLCCRSISCGNHNMKTLPSGWYWIGAMLFSWAICVGLIALIAMVFA